MKYLFPAAALLILAACSSTQIPDNADTRAQGQWQSIGHISNNNIAVAYDTGSIKKQGNTATLRDRKIVKDMSEENYLDLPHYKTAIGEWEFHCANRSYRLKAARYWDGSGHAMMRHDYSIAQTPFAPIVAGSPTETLFKAACH